MNNMLEGKKTYIGAAIVFVAGGLKALNIIDEQTFTILMGLGNAIGLFGLRKAVGSGK